MFMFQIAPRLMPVFLAGRSDLKAQFADPDYMKESEQLFRFVSLELSYLYLKYQGEICREPDDGGGHRDGLW